MVFNAIKSLFFKRKPFSHAVLIVEDSQLCLFMQKKIISEFTNTIDSAETIAAALKKLAFRRYDLVISGLRFPDGCGNDVVARVKKSPKSLNHQTPFIAITAHEESDKHQEAIMAGFSMVRMKSLSIDKAEAFLKAYPVKRE